jgi:hypothetical protein
MTSMPSILGGSEALMEREFVWKDVVTIGIPVSKLPPKLKTIVKTACTDSIINAGVVRCREKPQRPEPCRNKKILIPVAQGGWLENPRLWHYFDIISASLVLRSG